MFRQTSQRSDGQVQTVDYERVVRAIEALASTDASWYDGTETSIRDRMQRLTTVSAAARQVIHGGDVDDHRAALLQRFITSAHETRLVLSEVAEEFIDVHTQEALQALPQYGIAAGAPRLGETRTAVRHSADDVKMLMKGSQIQEFLAVEPKAFVRSNAEVLADASVMRVKAVDFVELKTQRVSSVALRASIVEEFVTAVERERRAAMKLVPRRTARVLSGDELPDVMLFM